MSHPFSLLKPAEKPLALTLIAGILFFTPYSVTLEVRSAHAEDPAEAAFEQAADPTESTESTEPTDSNDQSVSNDEPASANASGGADSQADSGNGGAGGDSGEAGDAGDGGAGAAAGETGDQAAVVESDANGGAGGDGGDQASASSTTVIETGDSAVTGEVVNSVNTNSTTASAASSTESDDDSDSAASSTASTTVPAEASSTTATTSTPASLSGTIDIKNQNTATATTDMAVDSDTGENLATTSGEAIIDTGTAIANANLLNVVNTNLFNSYGELLFLSNLWRNSLSHLDLRGLSFFAGDEQDPLSFCVADCRRSGMDIRNQNTATITNDVSANATTGDNSLVSSGSNLTSTGDAYAAANIINLANTNFVDSNYLFLTYNSFGDWDGDLVFPNADTFMSLFAHDNLPDGYLDSLDVRNGNTTRILDDLSVNATTGDNAISSDGGAISTGESSVATNVLTAANQNLFGGSSLDILFKVHGDWTGKLYGLPPGVTWKKTADGFVLSFDWLEGTSTDDVRSAGADIDIRNHNTASLSTTADVSASTGGNTSTSTDGEAFVDTGDAYAAANVIDVANTNVIGRNMFMAIVNIFGDWSGDIAFGKPDLWIGGHAEIDGASLMPGGNATYHFTVINNGDSAATDANVSVDLGSDSLAGSSGSRFVDIPVGTIAPKESKSVSFDAHMLTTASRAKDLVTSTARVSSAEKDNNLSDNEETVSISVGRSSSGHSRRKAVSAEDDVATSTTVQTELPALSVTASRSGSGPLQASSTVDYQVVIFNPSDSAVTDAKLHDQLTDQAGTIIHEEVWDLGAIAAGEEITVEYSVFFKPDTPGGLYTNSAYVTAFASTTAVTSNVSMTTLEIDPLQVDAAAQLDAATPSDDDSLSTTTSTSTAVSAEKRGGNSFFEPQAVLAYGEPSLLASAFFATPTGKQLTVLSIVLAGLAVAFAGLRRRLYR